MGVTLPTAGGGQRHTHPRDGGNGARHPIAITRGLYFSYLLPATVGGLLPDRYVLTTLARERLPVPSRMPLAQPQPGHPSHQVQLSRPDVPERHGGVLAPPPGELDVIRAHGLGSDVIEV